MSALPRFSRARQDGYRNLIAGRLHKLGAAGSTGTLPFSGHCDGAIHFHNGQVVYAESTRTPDVRAAAAGGGPQPPLRRLAAILAATEPTVDAALELMSTETRFSRFRPARAPAVDPACWIPVDNLLAEVTRRQRLLRQLSAVVTADTAVTRNPELSSPAVQVSAGQWALLIRVRPGSTPRALAWELRRSVFSTTAEVYRLLVLRLLCAAGSPAAPPALISFIRAVPPAPDPGLAAAPSSAKKGSPMPADSTASPAFQGER